MNRQITRVAGLAMALLIALIVATTYWQTWARPALAERQDNAIQRVAQFQIKRGLILSPLARCSHGTRSVASAGGRSTSAATRRAGSPRTSSATRPRPARERGSSAR